MHKKLKSFLCSINMHLLNNHKEFFNDVVSGKTVYLATCTCGKEYMVDTKFPVPLFKVEINGSKKII